MSSPDSDSLARVVPGLTSSTVAGPYQDYRPALASTARLTASIPL
jgi:hypothetical protein